MKCYRSEAPRTYVAPAGGVTSGVPAFIGSLPVIPQGDAAEGEDFAGIAAGVVELDKATGAGEEFAAGDDVFWNTDDEVCTTDSTYPRLGRTFMDAGTDDALLEVALLGLAAQATPAFGRARLNVYDVDAAATDGRALLVCQGAAGAIFAANTEGSATTAVAFASEDDKLVIQHNADPAANLGGVQVYFDEDADEGARLLCVSPYAMDVWVPTLGGRLLRVKHSADAATLGVAVYHDDNDDRLEFVSPTNTNGLDYTSSRRTNHAARYGVA